MNPPYSIMFHHFHGAQHSASQGSLSADDFEEMLEWLEQRYNIIDASTYVERFEKGKLAANDICLSFDDALLCQWDIALPILNKRDIHAFFFVYSSVFTGNPDFLEIYRAFRTTSFENLEDFYEQFFEKVKSSDEMSYNQSYEKYRNQRYLAEFPFYSEADKWFRYLRDQVLGGQNYNSVMRELMEAKQYDVKQASEKLWMKEGHLKALADDGHIIGLHSYSHPTQMSKLSIEDQKAEYMQNRQHLEGILGETIISMSHPCGDYNEDTLSVLKDMGIRIGFRSSLSVKEVKSALEIPRDDHANILKEMRP